MREPATGHANPYRGVNRLRRSFYRRLSLLGERLGIDSLTYNRGVFQSFHEAALANAPKIADAVMAEFPDTRSLADVGCGSGGFAAEFIRRGVRVMGCEYSARGREWCRRQGVPCVRFDVSRAGTGLEGTPYDLAMSLEVAKHVPATLADASWTSSPRARRCWSSPPRSPGSRARGTSTANRSPTGPPKWRDGA
ncbi:MAG: methyltransferase domain-containing protein [Phycisphaeraceae bacterium]|nr:methyltransferase domain-containing protein [Phycisphaeraceae bacterium]